MRNIVLSLTLTLAVGCVGPNVTYSTLSDDGKTVKTCFTDGGCKTTDVLVRPGASPTASPSPTPSPSPTATATATPSPTPSPTATPVPTPTPVPTAQTTFWGLRNISSDSGYIQAYGLEVDKSDAFKLKISLKDRYTYSAEVSRTGMTKATLSGTDNVIFVDVGKDAPGSGAFTVQVFVNGSQKISMEVFRM